MMLIVILCCLAARGVAAVDVRTAGDIAQALRQRGSNDITLNLVGSPNTCDTCLHGSVHAQPMLLTLQKPAHACEKRC